MADESKVLVALKLVGAASFAEAARAAGGALKGVGEGGVVAAAGIAKAGEAGTVAAGRLGRARAAAAGFGTAIKGVGKGVGVAGAAIAVATLGLAELAKSSVEKVQSLAETGVALQNIAGLSGGAGIRLAAAAKVTGVQSRQLGMSLKALATQATNATHGSKISRDTFKLLGITMKDVKGTGGDLTKLLMLVAEHLEKTKGGAGKLTAASKLLGRGWMRLNPLLEGGGRELRSLTRFAGSLGITLSGNTAKNLAKARDASYRWQLVMMALQLFVVNKLIPTMLKIASAAFQAVFWVKGHFNGLVSYFKGLPGKIADVGKGLWNGLKTGLVDVINWIGGQWNSLPFVGGGLDLGPIHIAGLPAFTPLGQTPSRSVAPTVTLPKSTISPRGSTKKTITPKGATPAPKTITPSGADMAPTASSSRLAMGVPIILKLDSQILHQGVYRVERARAEA